MSTIASFRKPHFVYVAAIESGGYLIGPCKVGISRDPDVRLASLQTGNPYPLYMAWFFKMPSREHAQKIEKIFSKNYFDYQLEREWFDINPTTAIGNLCVYISEYVCNEIGLEYPHARPFIDEIGVLKAERALRTLGEGLMPA